MDTIASLIDKLIVTNCRIWAAEDHKRRQDAPDAELAKYTKITNICNQQRNDLIQEIDQKINYYLETGEVQKLYQVGDTKMYGTNN